MKKKVDSSQKNESNSNINKFNQYKSLDIKERKLNINHNKLNNKFTNEQINNIITSKNVEKTNNIKDKLIPEQLNFFQKFLFNKNKADSLEKGPIKKYRYKLKFNFNKK